MVLVALCSGIVLAPYAFIQNLLPLPRDIMSYHCRLVFAKMYFL